MAGSYPASFMAVTFDAVLRVSGRKAAHRVPIQIRATPPTGGTHGDICMSLAEAGTAISSATMVPTMHK